MDGNNKALCFTIEIINAQFLTAGHYFLILRIIGSKVNRSKLKLFVGNSKLPLEDHEFTTDAALEDGDPETITTFTDSVISFWMPPGTFLKRIYNFIRLRAVIKGHTTQQVCFVLVNSLMSPLMLFRYLI